MFSSQRKADLTVTIRPMAPDECKAIAKILEYYAAREILLWRTAEDILAHVESFLVATCDDEILGCIALHDFEGGLFELRSLAVRHDLTGLGIGRQLVDAAIAVGRERGAIRLFALTSKQDFFSRFGFHSVPKEEFPQKVWRDCQQCRKRDACDETAVTFSIEGS